MPRDRFIQRKNAVLSKVDRSSVGEWDNKIHKLCDKINKTSDFYTTSSCSGRVILMISKDKKGKDLFLKIWHDKVYFDNFKEVLNNLLSKKEIIKFKLEPPILHVVCRDLNKATDILEKAKFLGFKRSSILTFDKNIVVEINSSERFEFPIIKNDKVLVDDEFLKLVLEMSNYKMERGWEKIKRLEKAI